MKVTALIPDELISEVKMLSMGENTTEALIIALKEWVAFKQIHRLNLQVREAPLKFRSGYSAEEVRKLNRRR